MTGAHTVFTAGNAIYLEPGFVVEAGATAIFETDTIQCKNLCPNFTNFPNRNCISQPIQIGNNVYENTFVQVTWQPTNYLDNPNSPNPTFTPPSGNGEITYYATYSSPECGLSNLLVPLVDSVNITYTNQPNVSPTISVTNVNFDDYSLNATVNVNAVTNEVVLSYVDVDGNTKTITYIRGEDFTNNSFQINLSNAIDNINCCSNTTLYFTANTFCSQSVYTNYVWEKNPDDFGFLAELPNVFSPNNDGVNDYFCFNAHACRYEFSVNHSWGTLLYYEEGNITSDNTCLNWQGEIEGDTPWYAPEYMPDGLPGYSVLIIYDDCGNVESMQRQLYVQNAGLIIYNPDTPIELIVTKQNSFTLINNNNSNEFYNVIITNAMGQIVLQDNFTNIYSAELASGIYFVNVITKSEEIILKQKIVIQN